MTQNAKTHSSRRKENRNTGFRYRSKARSLDPARECAFLVIRAVREDDAYANLLLPHVSDQMHLNKRDAAFATELCYGTLRMTGRYDAILARCSSRPFSDLDPQVLDLLRLGCHQLLGMRVPPHAAVDQSVDLARAYLSVGPSKFINAVLRRVSAKDINTWLDEITQGLPLPAALATALSYPDWIVWALADALSASGRSPDELAALLKAQNQPPLVHLCARPGLISSQQLADQAESALGVQTAYGKYSPYTVIISGGDPGRLPAVQKNLAGVEDEGSQLVAALLAAAPLESEVAAESVCDDVTLTAPPEAPNDKFWLDLCAGPGGKTALLGALGAQRHARVQAVEISPHRADLVIENTRSLRKTVTVNAADGARWAQEHPGQADRVLVDVPCSGLGSLRRRPEARFRRRPEDIKQLGITQKKLLIAALQAARVGAVVAYATCSPHLAETQGIIDQVSKELPGVFNVIDAAALARAQFPALAGTVGDGPYVQLWPHIHQTDAMFLALLRKISEVPK